MPHGEVEAQGDRRSHLPSLGSWSKGGIMTYALFVQTFGRWEFCGFAHDEEAVNRWAEDQRRIDHVERFHVTGLLDT